MKKLLGIILAGAMVVSGCGAEAQAPAKESAENEEAVTTETTEEVKEEVKAEETEEETVDITLKEVFEKHGLKVGTCVSSSELNKRSFKETVLSQFDSLTVENAMKPDSALNQAKIKEEGKVVVDFNKEVLTIL